METKQFQSQEGGRVIGLTHMHPPVPNPVLPSPPLSATLRHKSFYSEVELVTQKQAHKDFWDLKRITSAPASTRQRHKACTSANCSAAELTLMSALRGSRPSAGLVHAHAGKQLQLQTIPRLCKAKLQAKQNGAVLWMYCIGWNKGTQTNLWVKAVTFAQKEP